MIDHTGIGVADIGRSATFYDAALAALGMRRVMQMPDNVGLTASATASTILSFGSIDTTRIPSDSIPPLQPKPGPRSTHSMLLPSRQAEPKTERPASASRITTLHLRSIRTVTTSRRSFAETEGNNMEAWLPMFGLVRSSTLRG